MADRKDRPDDTARRVIIDRADRMLKQSRSLRQLSEQLQKESRDLKRESDDLRVSAKTNPTKRRRSGSKKRPK